MKKSPIIIKLFRFGRKHAPFYRLGVSQKSRSSSKKFALEFIGYYNPLTKDLKVDKNRLDFYTQNGALVSETLESLLKKNKLIKS